MTHSIGSERLKIYFSEPGHMYAEQRFDWNGFVTQVILDGEHSFCAYEETTPAKGTGGIGLCNAFMGITEGNYDVTPVGGQYVSVGVGKVTRTSDKPYSFFEFLPVEPFGSKVTVSGNRALFEQEGSECNGIAYRMKKELSAESNRLHIKTRLENTGKKPIRTTEFNHNFLCLGGHALGPDYRLSLPYTPKIEVNSGEFEIGESCLSLKARQEKGAFYCFVRNFAEAAAHKWTLTHLPSGLTVSETGDFKVEAFNLWGKAHVISPEVFVRLDIAPGSSFEWTREWEFGVRK